MSALKRKPVANRPNDVPLMALTEVMAIGLKSERQKHFNHLVNHLVLNNCHSNQCHDLSQLLSQLVSNIVHFQAFDDTIDKLLVGLNLYHINDKQIVQKYFELMSETINLKPIKCNQTVDMLIVSKFFSGYHELVTEKHIQPQEVIHFDEMHSVLAAIKVAKFETSLLGSIERKFPFFSVMSSIHSHLCYVHNVLKAYDYVTNKRKLLSIIVDQLLQIDSKVSSVRSEPTEEVFTIDDCNASKSDTNAAKQVDILDHLLELFMDFIDKKFANNSKEETEEMLKMFKQILWSEVFAVELSNHLPYIWLYLCSLSNQFFEQLIEYLWDLSLNPEISVDVRERSLYFLSSLLKNSTFVTTSNVMAFMNMCSLWVHRYIDQNDRVVDQLTSEDTIFYTLCQILFDIFCTIHSELDNLSLRRVKAMNFQRIIKCLLNPLSVCNGDIESKFISLARHHQIGYCTHNSVQSSDDRLSRPADVFNTRSYVCPKSGARIQNLCKYFIHSDNSFKENERFNRFNTSDDSDHVFGSYKMSYSPSKTLWQNLLSDSSPNEQMDFD